MSEYERMNPATPESPVAPAPSWAPATEAWTFPEVVVAPPPRRRATAYIGVVIGLIAMGGGALFWARSLGGGTSGGSDTPAAAVQRFFDALGKEDALGVLESLLPSEQTMIREPLQDATTELGRLGVLKQNIDLSKVMGVDLEFSDLAFSTTTVGPGVSTVRFQRGTVHYRVDPANSPLGDFVRGLIPDVSNAAVEGSDDLVDEDASFTTVREGGKWYLSMWYSAAESARVEAGLPVPNFGHGLAARGAATPEKAAEDLIRAAAALDVRRLIELTPPDEARALHDYAPLFIDAAEAGAREARHGYTANIRDLKLSSHQTSAGTVVKIDNIVFDVNISDGGLAFGYDGKCATFSGGFFGTDRPQRQCGGGMVPSLGIPKLPTPDIGIVTVEQGGQWFVSPTRTLTGAIVGTLRALRPSDLEELKKLFQSFMMFPMN